jgi:hypothetical protein
MDQSRDEGSTPAEEGPLSVAKRIGRKVINILNTSLGIWLLSAVFLSGFSAFYRDWKAAADKEDARAQSILDLHMEISYRLSRAMSSASRIFRIQELLYEVDTVDSYSKPVRASATLNPGVVGSTPYWRRYEVSNKEELQRQLDDAEHPSVWLTRPASVGFQPLNEKFEKFTLQGLLVELHRNYEGDEEQQKIIEELLQKLSDPMLDQFLTGESKDAWAVCLFARITLAELTESRWSVGSPYWNLNCDPDYPFCEIVGTSDGEFVMRDGGLCAAEFDGFGRPPHRPPTIDEVVPQEID